MSKERTALDTGAEVRLREAADLLGVSPDTVRRWIDAGRLVARRTRGGQRRIDGAALARLAAEGASARGSSGGSARNRFRGIVTRVVRDRVAAHVEIQAGPHRVVSLISREAADELGLKPGVLADAVVKATNLGIELSPARRTP